MTELVNQIASNGILGVILGFVLLFVIKPISDSFKKNIDLQTEVLSKISQNLDYMKNELQELKEEIKDLKNRWT